ETDPTMVTFCPESPWIRVLRETTMFSVYAPPATMTSTPHLSSAAAAARASLMNRNGLVELPSLPTIPCATIPTWYAMNTEQGVIWQAPPPVRQFFGSGSGAAKPAARVLIALSAVMALAAI